MRFAQCFSHFNVAFIPLTHGKVLPSHDGLPVYQRSTRSEDQCSSILPDERWASPKTIPLNTRPTLTAFDKSSMLHAFFVSRRRNGHEGPPAKQALPQRVTVVVKGAAASPTGNKADMHGGPGRLATCSRSEAQPRRNVRGTAPAAQLLESAGATAVALISRPFTTCLVAAKTAQWSRQYASPSECYSGGLKPGLTAGCRRCPFCVSQLFSQVCSNFNRLLDASRCFFGVLDNFERLLRVLRAFLVATVQCLPIASLSAHIIPSSHGVANVLVKK